jgi:hypothetical protein
LYFDYVGCLTVDCYVLADCWLFGYFVVRYG